MKACLGIGLLAAVALFAVACGSGGKESDTTEEEAFAVAEKALLQLDDFPTGWVERPREEEEDVDLELPPRCQAIIEQETPAGALANAETQAFHGPNDELVESGVSVFADAEAAEQAMQELRDFVEECSEPFERALLDVFRDAVKQDLEDSEEDISVEDIVADFNFDRLSFPSFGDDSVALRMSASFEVGLLEFDFLIDLIGTRVGKVTSGFSLEAFDEPPDPTLEEQLMKIIENRVADADSELD